MTVHESKVSKFFRKLGRYDVGYVQRKIYDRKLMKGMESRRHASRLDRALGLSAVRVESRMSESAKVLSPFYDDYVANTSNEVMAVSLELSTFLLLFCEIRRPKRILDLGSGFSTFCLRHWARHHALDTDVWSVDDAPEWLEKTRNFLIRHDLPGDRLLAWDEFLAADRGRFDLILYDFGPFPLRMSSLGKVIGLASRPAAIILDDMHAAEYGLYVKQTFRERGLPCLSIRRYTKDRFGRYAHLALT